MCVHFIFMRTKHTLNLLASQPAYEGEGVRCMCFSFSCAHTPLDQLTTKPPKTTVPSGAASAMLRQMSTGQKSVCAHDMHNMFFQCLCKRVCLASNVEYFSLAFLFLPARSKIQLYVRGQQFCSANSE
jgi:hypothetical protein